MKVMIPHTMSQKEKGEKANTWSLAAQRGLPDRPVSVRGKHCQQMETYFEDLKTRKNEKAYLPTEIDQPL